ncbi:hypothetical protein [Capnocytophaga haemolytica]
MTLKDEKTKALQTEWYTKGEQYAKAVNEMVAFAEANGWENWKGENPVGGREHLAAEVFALLKEANKKGEVTAFRELFPPAVTPFWEVVEEKTKPIRHLCYISEHKLAFIVGAPYEGLQAYIVDNGVVTPLEKGISALGKAVQGEVFAIRKKNTITTTKGWQGEVIATIAIPEELEIESTVQLLPFNDGKRVVLVSFDGIYILSETDHKRLLPIKLTKEDVKEGIYIDMPHAALSHNNQYIAAGDQDSKHHIFDAEGKAIGYAVPSCSYPHFALFAKDDSQVAFNSCHFYNGVTIAVNAADFDKKKVGSNDDEVTLIDEEMRVYAGVATTEGYILGDANGYIRAFTKEGKLLWRYFLGGTISGMAISDDEQTPWVGTYFGQLHQLQLNKGWRDTHTIGTAKHYEDFRLIFWKKEPILKW